MTQLIVQIHPLLKIKFIFCIIANIWNSLPIADKIATSLDQYFAACLKDIVSRMFEWSPCYTWRLCDVMFVNQTIELESRIPLHHGVFTAPWRSAAILTCKSIVKLGYRGERNALRWCPSIWYSPRLHAMQSKDSIATPGTSLHQMVCIVQDP